MTTRADDGTEDYAERCRGTESCECAACDGVVQNEGGYDLTCEVCRMGGHATLFDDGSGMLLCAGCAHEPEPAA